jgi:hypothetical protein
MSKLTEKVQKKYPEFTEVVDGMSVENLKKSILQYNKHNEEINDQVNLLNEPGNALYLAKAAVSEITGPINDSRTAIKLKISYMVQLIEEKGGSVS